MSTNKTLLLLLHHWIETDFVDMDEFNQNWDKIDSEIGKLNTDVLAAKNHIDATTDIHGATSTVTNNAIIQRDANGQASVGTPTQNSHIARKMDVDAVQNNLNNHLGIGDSSITEIKAILREVDTRNVQITRTNGKIATITIRDNTTTVLTYTINRGSDGKLSSIVETGGGKTITHTLNRTDGLITSITKTVV